MHIAAVEEAFSGRGVGMADVAVGCFPRHFWGYLNSSVHSHSVQMWTDCLPHLPHHLPRNQWLIAAEGPLC